MIYCRLEIYLNEYNLVDKIEDIKKILINKANNERLPFILYSTTFIALFLPLWNIYLNYLLENFKNDLKEITYISLIIFIIILSFTFYIPLIYSFRDSFLTRYRKINNLIDLLDEYKIRTK